MEIALYSACLALAAAVGFLAGRLIESARGRSESDSIRSLHTAREDFLMKIAASEREIHAKERSELYSRIQAYDPNVGNYEPRPAPSITEPSRPAEDVPGPRSYTAEELGQMRLVLQADGMLRDARSEALYETVEDWRFWQEELRKRSLSDSVHPGAVQELGWEEAVSISRANDVKRKSVR